MNNLFCDIVLIRHGQTDWNAVGKMQGHSDIPLNSVGQAQALELSEELKHLNFAAAYSSDLSRAMQTARIVVADKGLNVVGTDSLRERSMGAWEGRVIPRYEESASTEPIQHRSQAEYLNCRVDAMSESYSDVFTRLEKFLSTLASRHPGQLVLLSSHAGVLSSLLYKLDFRDGLRWSISNCGHVKVRVWPDGRMRLLSSAGLSLKPYFCLCQAVRH